MNDVELYYLNERFNLILKYILITNSDTTASLFK